MKKEFFDWLLQAMKKNKDVYFISCGLGWPRTDDFLQFKDRYIQTEASEQTALDIACGLAYSGKIPFIYTITPFFYRGFETIRTYIDHEQLNVKLIGAGVGGDYSDHGDGYTHDAKDIKSILATQENIMQYYPNTNEQMKMTLDIIMRRNGPCFLNIHR